MTAPLTRMSADPTQPASEAVKAVLLCAAEIVRGDGQWTRGTLARDSNWGHVDPLSEQAERWCAIGAIRLAAYEYLELKSRTAGAGLASTCHARAEEVLQRELGYPAGGRLLLARYNDAAASAEQVAALLERSSL